ncbi:MAG: type II toxin-antitoxin system RatA family toxin [Proteobacteria bacterium]|nr:type II toxin-antitoxin system RatA family toxin [Pseudomonadota bacterium]
MREVRRSALVPQSPAQMYAIVNDVRQYPAFLAWCPSTRVLEETAESITATLELRRAGLTLALTTRNTMRPGEWIEMTLVDGPLRAFHGRWDFVPIRAAGADEPVRGCRVELAVGFQFANAALGVVLGPLFESTWNALVDAFVRRARELHPARA